MPAWRPSITVTKIARPSWDQLGDIMVERGIDVSGRGWAPSASAIQTLSDPVLSLMKASERPSGENRGCD
ncbi:MAG TPA: hypothetical protein PKW63_00710 [Vicinamibacterales bacterium]|nr:hypothetical protein [Vicinamibacterales bacterium]